MELAKFSFENYIFSDVEVHVQNATDNLKLNLHPEGIFDAEHRQFSLMLEFQALSENKEPDNLLVYVKSLAQFQFSEDVVTKDMIPDYFYANSVAIVYPYLRAFLSSLTIQTNTRPIVLPTMNLTSLGDELKKNTSIV